MEKGKRFHVLANGVEDSSGLKRRLAKEASRIGEVYGWVRGKEETVEACIEAQDGEKAFEMIEFLRSETQRTGQNLDVNEEAPQGIDKSFECEIGRAHV